MSVELAVTPGQSIDGYEVVGVLGRGSFGTVYRAQREGQVVALKWMTGMDLTSREEMLRFQREVDIASTLKHPNLVSVLGHGFHEERPYLLMELVEGQTLQALQRQHPAGAADLGFRGHILDVAAALFSALQYIHSKRVVHRDIKPENVYLDRDGRARLGDFGLAFLDIADARRSVQGTVVGTVAYMAPEMLRGREPDRRSDMFSLGILLAELIAGRLPYPGEEFNVILATLMSTGPQRLSKMGVEVPEALDNFVARMTALVPEERFYTLAHAWRAWQEAISTWNPPAAPVTPVQPAPAPAELLLPVFVDREIALTLLDTHLEQARRDHRCVVTITGPPGIGRSRLLSHWSRQSRENAFTIALHAGSAEDAPYEPFLGVVRETRVALQSALARTKTLSVVMGSAPGCGPRRSLLDSSVLADRLQLMADIEAMFYELAGTSTLIVTIDDAQNLDDASAAFLRYLVRPKAKAGLLIVLAVRGDDPAPIIPIGAIHPLEPLAEAAVDSLARSALGLGKQALPPGIEAALAQARGNPLMILESLEAWLDGGVLKLGEDGWQWEDDLWHQQGFRPSASAGGMQAIVERLQQRLDQAAWKVLVAVAVTGDKVTFEQLEQVWGLPSRNLLDAIDHLLDSQLLTMVPSQHRSSYRLVTPEIGRQAVALMSADERVDLHRRWVEVLQRGADVQHTSQTSFRLLQHAQEAADRVLSIRLLEEAAELAAGSYAYERAWSLQQRLVTSSVGAPPDVMWGRRLRLAEFAYQAGRAQEGLKVCEELLRTASEPIQRFNVYRLMGSTALSIGDFASAMRHWHSSLATLGISVPTSWPGVVAALARRETRSLSAEHAVAVAEIAHGITELGFLQGAFERELVYFLGLMRQLAGRLREPALVGRVHLANAGFHMNRPGGPDVKRALQALQEAERCATALPPSPTRVDLMAGVAYFFYHAGDLEASWRLAVQGRGMAREIGDHQGTCLMAELGSLALRRWGRLQEARQSLEECLPLVDLMQHRRLGYAMRVRLALVYYQLGMYDEAWDKLTTPTPYELPYALDMQSAMETRGLLYLQNGELERAVEELQHHVEETDRTHSGLGWQVLSRRDLALVLADMAHAPDATDSGRKALATRLGRLLKTARRLAARIPIMEAHVRLIDAELTDLQGQPDRALRILEEQLAACGQLGLYNDAAITLDRIALLRKRRNLGDWEAAQAEAHAMWAEIRK